MDVIFIIKVLRKSLNSSKTTSVTFGVISTISVMKIVVWYKNRNTQLVLKAETNCTRDTFTLSFESVIFR